MRKAFTLIELLVVIAIIAILAAILFPVFAQAKLAAKKTADLSNLKNIGSAEMMYMSDNDDMFPRHEYSIPGRNDGGGWNVPFNWRDAIMPYVKNGNKGYGTTNVQTATGGIFETPAKVGARNAYGMNRQLTPGKYYWDAAGGGWISDSTDLGVVTGRPVYPSASSTQVDLPAQIALNYTIGVNPDWNAAGDYTDSGWYWMSGAAPSWPPPMTGPTSHEKWDADANFAPTYSVPRYRYTQGMNANFTDGHAKYVKKGAFNYCVYLHVMGRSTDMNAGAIDNWDWLFTPGNPCQAFAR